ncbi:hypothetical protein B2H83_18260 [Escherichia coli M8]|nr:hypothetical protein [Escherichia coli]AQW74586.1 hypothetical protein B2H83_18260 [Escherichia coli M8]
MDLINHPSQRRMWRSERITGKYQQAIQAATAAVQGLAGGNLSAALAGGAASSETAAVRSDMSRSREGRTEINKQRWIYVRCECDIILAYDNAGWMFHHPNNSGISAITMYEFYNEENYLFSVRGAFIFCSGRCCTGKKTLLGC